MEAIILNTVALTKNFGLTVLAFVVTVLVTPAFTTFLYRNRLGKKIRQTDFNEKSAPIFYKLHQHKAHPDHGRVIDLDYYGYLDPVV